MLYLDLIFNLALLVALSVVSGFIDQRWPRHTRVGPLLQGILFGGVAVFAMLRPLVLEPGLIFDGRSVMASLAAFFFGPLAALPVAAMTITCRVLIGGSGVLTGSLVILSSVSLGLLFRARRAPRAPSSLGLYVFGLTVHLAMLALMFTLPLATALKTLNRTGPPVLLLYPLATILMGKILSDQEAHARFVSALEAAREQLETTLRSIGDAVISTDLLGRVVLINPVAERLTGWSADEARGRPLAQVFPIFHGTTDAPQESPVDKVLREGQVVELANHTTLRARSGKRYAIADSAAPIRNERGDLLGVVLVFRDVTQKHAMRQALAESEERLRLALDATSQGLYDYDIASGIAKTNDEYARMLGRDPATFTESRQGFLTRLHPEDHERVLATLREYLDGLRDKYEVSFRQRLPSGEWRWILSRGQVMTRRDGTPHLLGTHTDITEQRLAEEAHARLQDTLAQSQKLESVGRLAGGVAHDFNNMLGVILGHTELVLEQLGADDPLRPDLEEVRSAAHRSAQLTRQLLAFARKGPITPKILHLNEVIEGMLKMLRRLIGEGITLNWRPSPALAPVCMDPTHVDQLMMNLCLNARDALEGNGQITIETGSATLSEAECALHVDVRPGCFTVLTVSDNGPGMDSETLAHLFEPFFTTKPKGKGTGLGMATVHGIVKQMQGLIQVDSAPGQGTRLKLFLPNCQGTQELPEPTEPPTLPTGNETILLVEDEAAILNLARAILTRQGYTVLAATTPNDALRLTEETSPALLLTDVIMPEMNGWALSQALRAKLPGLKCLFMSGYTGELLPPEATARDLFLAKPFSAADLSTRVREALDC